MKKLSIIGFLIGFFRPFTFGLFDKSPGIPPEQKRWIEDYGEKDQFLKSQKPQP